MHSFRFLKHVVLATSSVIEDWIAYQKARGRKSERKFASKNVVCKRMRENSAWFWEVLYCVHLLRKERVSMCSYSRLIKHKFLSLLNTMTHHSIAIVMLYRGCEDDQLLYTFPLHVKFLNASWAHMMHYIGSDSQHVIIQIITRHSRMTRRKCFWVSYKCMYFSVASQNTLHLQ